MSLAPARSSGAGTDHPGGVPVRVATRHTHRWPGIVGIWLASRAVTTAWLLFFASQEPATFWAAAHPGYFRFAQFWDSGWFHTIATSGYPLSLPVDAAGQVVPNAWAFLPAYPAVVSLITAATGLPWDVASVLVSAACSLGAALVFARLLTVVLGRPALFAVALLCFAPLSAVFQVAYAESMCVLLLAAALLLLVQHRYLLLIPVVLLLDLTRPVGLPVALTLVIHVAVRLVSGTRDRRELLAALGAMFAAGAGAVAWPAAAWLATGVPSAYLRSELAWRTGRTGADVLVPFASWIRASTAWAPGGLGPALLALLVLGFAAALLWSPAVRRLGADLRVWSGAYALYLLGVFDPQSSTFRLLVPLFPLLGAAPRSWIVRVGLLAAGVLGQAVWIAATWADWHVHGWSPP